VDNKDIEILKLLQQDSTLSLVDISEQVNLSPTPCWKRIKRLEEDGIIRQRVALLDSASVDLKVSVFVHIKTRHHDNQWLETFSAKVSAFDEVVEFYRMSGEWDYLLRVVVKDIETFDEFYKKLVNSVEGLTDVTSSFSMEQIKYTTALPIR